MNRSKSFLWRTLAVALLFGLSWSIWVYQETRPQSLVNRSAVRNYNAALAEAKPEAAPAPKHRATTAEYIVWKDLTEEQKRILNPLEKRWDYLSANQRRSLLQSARRYPDMSEEQRTRFSSRLVQWTRLTGKERREMRERYKAFATLPQEQQEQVKKSWFEHAEPDSSATLLHTGSDESSGESSGEPNAEANVTSNSEPNSEPSAEANVTSNSEPKGEPNGEPESESSGHRSTAESRPAAS